MICKTWSSFHLEVEKLKKYLSVNAYPEWFVSKTIYRFLNSRLLTIKRNKPNETTPRYNFKIPYIGKPSLLLKKKLINIFKKQNISVNCTFVTVKVSSYFILKDKTSSLLQASLIYKFTCQGDPDIAYIGKTKRYLQQRIVEHRRGNSAIFDHIMVCDHCSNHSPEDGFKGVHRVSGDLNLSILEALYIKQFNPHLNKQLFNSGTNLTLKVF